MINYICKNLELFSSDVLADINDINNLPEDITNAMYHNKWFSIDNTIFALTQFTNSLSNGNAEKWLHKYKLPTKESKKIILILAGNIPAVGFHDILCTLISGNIAIIKTSSKDEILIKYLCKKLTRHFPEWTEKCIFTDSIIKDFDAVIATGSNNSKRYFEKYFSKVPSIIRHHRNSIAILDGNETDDDLNKLKKDIFLYFGLGCRNVSLIFVPENYNWKKFIAIMNVDNLMSHNAYNNNYAYYKAYFALMDENIIDCGSFLLRENDTTASPISVIHFSYYKNITDVQKYIDNNIDNTQCVVSSINSISALNFGEAQQPKIDEYADNIDTIKFLLNI